MARIVGIGIATIDVISVTRGFPAEDAEVRAVSRQSVRGGNVTNSLSVLAQYGHQCIWGGTLGDDDAAKLVIQDLQAQHIDTSRALLIPGGSTPVSNITINQENGSRTIVHYRDLPELPAIDFDAMSLDDTDWLHFEGRNIEETGKMILSAKTRQPTLPISVEIEKPRPNIDALFSHADVLFFSRPFAQSRGFDSARSFLESTQSELSKRNNNHSPDQQLLICTWGNAGAWALDSSQLYHSPAIAHTAIVETLGAGDTFNAAFIHALLQHQQPKAALDYACFLAGKKCGQSGFNNLVDNPVEGSGPCDTGPS